MMKYIPKIQTRVNIHARKRTNNLFDGSYKSIYTGNGLDFENLREYIPGDNIRDIDWKASARSKNLLVKRYIAEKKHNICLVLDSGINFLADTKALESKKEIALYTAGTISYLAAVNGDNVGAVYNRDGLIQFHPLRAGLNNVERILTEYDRQAFGNYRGNLSKSLDYVIRNISKRMIVFVISDMKGIHSIDEATLKKLHYLHDVLFISISDAPLTGSPAYNVESSLYMADYITGNKKLQKAEEEIQNRILEDNHRKLIKNQIVSTVIDSEEEITNQIIELLEKHKYADNR